ncbi:MAG: pyridoxamine 5'-phosphate oxidase family protein [Acidobacteriales bacterium]|nr:pyridoxamine 5'-phosphate oxidase family protein [Terriglobales bacterium]
MAISESPSARTKVKRIPERGSYEREIAYAILDEAFICHVGFLHDSHPFVIPTGFGRDGDRLYIHGSAASRMLRTLDSGVPLCVTVTLLDGLVLARSIFHHSMNYRSVVVLGTAHAVHDRDEKLRALRLLSEHMIPGRWEHVRPPNEQELKATLVLKLPIEEFSVKTRSGPPGDDEADVSLPIWAGVLPLNVVPGTPIPDAEPGSATEPPPEVTGYTRKKADKQ